MKTLNLIICLAKWGDYVRIIDKRHDFYDYLQDPTDDLVFDRRNSFMFTKELFCDALEGLNRYSYRFVLMQAGVTHWLFLVKLIRDNGKYTFGRVIDYNIELLYHWKNYNKRPELVTISEVSFYYDYNLRTDVHGDYSPEKVRKNISKLVDAIDRNDVDFCRQISQHKIYTDYKESFKIEVKDIPIIAPSGIGKLVDPSEMFYAIEEYFSMMKMASEKTVAEGTTELDKISAHGFDVKTSFRG